jgi:hypothetical protein
MLLILPWNSSAINGCLLLFGILKHSIIASYACRSGGKYFPIISQSIQPSRPIKFLVLNHSLSENKAAHLLAVLKEHAFCKQSATILPSFCLFNFQSKYYYLSRWRRKALRWCSLTSSIVPVVSCESSSKRSKLAILALLASSFVSAGSLALVADKSNNAMAADTYRLLGN